ncbi:MAG: glycoside hydrolase family 1 protein [Simkania sp.]|nr:glycoside hydrolase family 1 protein [Simkania sp.]
MLHQASGDFHEVLKDPSLWGNLDFEGSKPLGHGNPDFLYGVATSMYQDSGAVHCPQSQWSDWESRCMPAHDRSGAAVNLFALYQKEPLSVISKLQLLGVNTYRFSIEWSHLEPEKGKLDVEKLKTYVEFCKILRDYGIQPIITLHHFSEPLWFHSKGSFEKEENISDFLGFCQWAVKELAQEYQGKPLVQYFCTINEPGVEAYSRYLLGFFSPNLRFRFTRGARFLLNMLKAHCRVYSTIKKTEDVRIGISHQYLQYYSTHFLMYPMAKILSLYHQAVLKFFKTGLFDCKIPFLSHVEEDCIETEKPKVDFAGVQYYGRIFLGLKGLDPKNKPATTMMGICEDPEGLFEAIIAVFDAFRSPILVSENGISTECNEQRARYVSRALYAAEQARKKIGSENMLGYILWSFTDNFEWSFGWKPQFGAFPLTKDRSLGEQYKPGIQPFVDTIRAWKSTLPSFE